MKDCDYGPWTRLILPLSDSNKFGRRHDTQHNDIQYKDIQHNDIQHNDIQHKDIQHNDIQHNDIQHSNTQYNNKKIATLSKMSCNTVLLSVYAKCH